MKQYLELLRTIRDHGTRKDDRTGTGTLSIFGHQLRCDLRAGFPLLTTKKLRITSYNVCYTKLLRNAIPIKIIGADNTCPIVIQP